MFIHLHHPTMTSKPVGIKPEVLSDLARYAACKGISASNVVGSNYFNPKEVVYLPLETLQLGSDMDRFHLTPIPPTSLHCPRSRFLINIPDEDKDDPVKLCTHIELAHWFYLDLQRPEDPSLPACSMKEFMATSILPLLFLFPSMQHKGVHCK